MNMKKDDENSRPLKASKLGSRLMCTLGIHGGYQRVAQLSLSRAVVFFCSLRPRLAVVLRHVFSKCWNWPELPGSFLNTQYCHTAWYVYTHITVHTVSIVQLNSLHHVLYSYHCTYVLINCAVDIKYIRTLYILISLYILYQLYSWIHYTSCYSFTYHCTYCINCIVEMCAFFS